MRAADPHSRLIQQLLRVAAMLLTACAAIHAFGAENLPDLAAKPHVERIADGRQVVLPP